MRILVSPVLVGDRICRIVSPIASLLEVEEWVGEWWEPSTVTLTTASQAGAAPQSLLEERGVPREDFGVDTPRTADGEIQQLMHAGEPVGAPMFRIDEGPSRRDRGARRKQYPGNARFRRGKRTTDGKKDRSRDALDRADLRRTESRTEWHGPYRRATDVPPAGGSANTGGKAGGKADANASAKRSGRSRAKGAAPDRPTT